tara:strand:+ start:390 stop:584 length:195 start_codon:yes stop_codon:yes gene_type:complete
MTETPRDSDERGRKIVLEIELDDHIAHGLDQMVFKTQTSGMLAVWDARMLVKDLLDKYEQERDR